MGSFLSPQLKRLSSYAAPYRFSMGLGVALLLVVGLAEAVIGLMIKPIIDRVLNPAAPDSNVLLFSIPHGPTFYLNHIFPHSIHNVWAVVSISLLVVFVVKSLAEFGGSTLVQFAGLRALTDFRNQVYAKIIRQTFSFFAFLFVLLYVDWRMTLGCAIFLPLIAWPIGKLGRKIRHSVESSQNKLGELNQILQETVAGNRVVKAFGMEDFEIGKFRAAAKRLLRETMRWIRAQVASSPLMDLLLPVVISLLLLYARDKIRHEQLTIGLFFTFLYALLKSYEPVKRLGAVYQQLQQAQGATTQVFAYLDMKEEERDAPDARELPPFSHEIEFENVCFSYDKAPILRDIRFTARKGELVAFVGSSGAGKTTLVNLIPRFYEVTSGSIRVDGRDIRSVKLGSLRGQIAMVAQENILFHDTVWNNICYGQSNVSRERVVQAAQAALAHDFIQELPQGYETLIGERGTRLSGGQRQRIAIARAILKDSPILILDEATSELDSESEMYVQKALANLMVGRTTFVIAHRLGTIRKADKILVLEDGQIRESGTHAELLARGGSYARLHDLQFADQDAVTPAGAASTEPMKSGNPK